LIRDFSFFTEQFPQSNLNFVLTYSWAFDPILLLRNTVYQGLYQRTPHQTPVQDRKVKETLGVKQKEGMLLEMLFKRDQIPRPNSMVVSVCNLNWEVTCLSSFLTHLYRAPPLPPGVRCVQLFYLDRLVSFRKNLATSESPRARLLTSDGRAGTCCWNISIEAAVTRLSGTTVVP